MPTIPRTASNTGAGLRKAVNAQGPQRGDERFQLAAQLHQETGG